MLTRSKGAFTLVEVVAAFVILSVAVLGLGASASKLATEDTDAEVRSMALYAVNHRLDMIERDPRYEDLDRLYSATESDVLTLPGYTRTTVVESVAGGGAARGYKTVTVTVSGPALPTPITRRLTIVEP